MSASDPAVTRDHRWDPCLPRALAKQVARLVRVRFPPPPPSHGIGRDVIKGEVAPRPTCCEASGGVIKLLEVHRRISSLLIRLPPALVQRWLVRTTYDTTT